VTRVNTAPLRGGFWRFDNRILLSLLYEFGAEPFAIACEICSSVSHGDRTMPLSASRTVTLHRGDVAISQRQVAQRTRVPLATVNRWIRRFQQPESPFRIAKQIVEQTVEQTAEQKTKQRFTVFTVLNSEAYLFATPPTETDAGTVRGTASRTASGTSEERSTERRSTELVPAPGRAASEKGNGREHSNARDGASRRDSGRFSQYPGRSE
jgi:hypothetical protein